MEGQNGGGLKGGGAKSGRPKMGGPKMGDPKMRRDHWPEGHSANQPCSQIKVNRQTHRLKRKRKDKDE